MTVPEPERLQKALARAGYGSRRACEELIAAGRVTLNGAVAVLGNRADVSVDRVEVDGVPVREPDEFAYYLLHKPVGVVSTASDPQGRPTVVELVPASPRVVPVGRLDLDTEGLIILTNDGELTNLLTHPSHGVEKVYLAEVRGTPDAAALRALAQGVALDDGPATATKVRRRGDDDARGVSAIEITVHEGRNRMVRRMCDAIGHPVERLVRTRIGPLTDPHLEAGQWRPLRFAEVRALYGAGQSH